MIDNLEKLEIARHFSEEIKGTLDETYKRALIIDLCWFQHDEEIYLDVSTFAMAFWLLRLNGYNISSGTTLLQTCGFEILVRGYEIALPIYLLSHANMTNLCGDDPSFKLSGPYGMLVGVCMAAGSTNKRDALAQFSEEKFFFDSLGCHIKDSSTVLQLHKASQIMTCSKELVLEELNSWSSHFLQRELSKDAMHVDGYQNYIKKEVDYVLKFPWYANLERLYHRRYIEHYIQEIKILKTSYRYVSVSSQ
ncbi:ent-kaur-16-ene synthase, chloroplastic isoform X1 [Cinnamomum micranthum f. kanehirae]|uniref:Ent-kaur-16-ene synthase, chloroplastic isoform X1 n=1 Tax=Cinnamomum micranthum f. kanehirae TaxID=337451 RepID=A0A3S3QRH5_9MAGN|nr:ent-kaur-16-ene synthase, chloroplastic isoform X1 [Cinnamomum micranthum f. kanehirae]